MAFGSLLQRLLRVNAATPYSWTLPSADAAGAVVSDGAGTIRMVTNPNCVFDFRLTLSTGVPVTTADVSAAVTLFCSPLTGNRADLYDGTNWNRRTSAEFSITLAALTASKPYDVFVFDNAGVPTLELLVWTNATTRATALTTQDGVLVKTGALTRRYVGTIFINSAGGQSDDSLAKRYLWNYYNRRARRLARIDNSGWTYSTATIRQAKASTSNQVEAITGVAEEEVFLTLVVNVSNSDAATLNIQIGIGLDSTTTVTGNGSNYDNGVANKNLVLNAVYGGFPGLGYHFFSWNESGGGTVTTTWVARGNNGLEGFVWG